MRTTLATAVAAIGVAATLAACSSATAGSAHQHTRLSPAAHTSSPLPSPPRSSAPAPYPSSSRASDPTTAPAGGSDVDRALLAAADLGAGFSAATPDSPAPLPCTPDRGSVDDQVRHVEKGSAVFVDDIAGVQVSEQIYVYGAVAGAQRHQAIVDAGLACRHGSLNGAAVTVLGPTDVRSQLARRPDSAQVWIVHTDQVAGALVAVRVHAVIVQFAVVSQNGDAGASHLDVKKVVETGLTKLFAVANG